MHILLIETIALVGATVHTMEPGAPPIPAATVVIEDDRIVAVGAGIEVPEGARTIDLAGLHLMPGLIDGWASFDADHDVLYLDAGVTTVHDSGSPTGEMLKEKTLGMRERNPGPSLLTTSPVFASSATTRPGALVLGDAAATETQVDEVFNLVEKAGARLDSITFDGSILPSQHRIVVAAATERGAPAMGPVPRAMGVQRASEQGQRALVGLDSLLPAGERFDSIKNAEEVLTPAVTLLGEQRWAAVPLLMGTARITRGVGRAQERTLQALSPGYGALWRSDVETFAILKGTPGMQLAGRSLERQRALTARLAAAGTALVPGSGAPSGLICPGSGLVDELEELAAAGLATDVILAAATRGAAEHFRAADEIGRVAAGLRADLIALGSDPTRSLEALRRPEMVVVRGKPLERFELDEMVDALIARQEAARVAQSAPIALEPPPMPDGELLATGTLDLVAYGARTAVERYEVRRLEDGRMAYGARIRVVPTATEDAREMILVQVVEGNLVERFDLTLDVVDADGKPRRENPDVPAFVAVGTRVGESKKLGIERAREGKSIASQRTEEAIALIEGSAALSMLVPTMHAKDGAGYFIEFDGLLMEPVVDRFVVHSDPSDGRVWISDARGRRVFGVGPTGQLLFGARAERGGRLDFMPGDAPAADASGLTVPEKRVFTGDPKRWNEAPAEASSGRGDGTAGDGK